VKRRPEKNGNILDRQKTKQINKIENELKRMIRKNTGNIK